MESLSLRFGATVDKNSFAQQVRRIEELRKAVYGMLVGGSEILWRGMDHDRWAEKAFEIRRSSRTTRMVRLPPLHRSKDEIDRNFIQPVRVELLQGQRLKGVAPCDVRPGDDVEIPIWINIWYPPAGLNIHPIPSPTFDRIVILSRGS